MTKTSDAPQETGSPPALVLSDISKSYRVGTERVMVLKGISFCVDAGTVVWLKGRSGSGKSSLLRVAGLLSTADTGIVRLGGVAVRPGDGRLAAGLRRRKVGFVFQGSNLLADLTGVENLYLASPEIDREQAVRVLERYGLGMLADRPAKAFSGGEAQRVAFARAIVKNPPLILVDEPTAGLDQDNSAEILATLSDARKSGHAVLIASHDPAVAGIADVTVELDHGQIQ